MAIYNKVVHITAAAGSSGTTVALEVPPAQRFRLKRVLFIFPPGTKNSLELAVLYGIKQMVPNEGMAVGDDVTYWLEDDTELGGSEKLKVYYKNNDTVNDLEAFVVIEGEIMYG